MNAYMRERLHEKTKWCARGKVKTADVKEPETKRPGSCGVKNLRDQYMVKRKNPFYLALREGGGKENVVAIERIQNVAYGTEGNPGKGPNPMGAFQKGKRKGDPENRTKGKKAGGKQWFLAPQKKVGMGWKVDTGMSTWGEEEGGDRKKWARVTETRGKLEYNYR